VLPIADNLDAAAGEYGREQQRLVGDAEGFCSAGTAAGDSRDRAGLEGRTRFWGLEVVGSELCDDGVVVVVDDDVAVRNEISSMCESVGLVVLSHANLGSLERGVHSSTRGCIVLDMRLPGLGGVPAVERVSRLYPNLAIIGISEFVDARTVMRSLRAGAVDFFDKPFSTNELLESIQLAMQRQLAFPVRDPGGRSETEYRRLLKTLTRRQKDVLAQYGAGTDEREIARRLGLHLRTVQRHLRNALAVLEISRDDRHVVRKLHR